jgi:hypothetical protein
MQSEAKPKTPNPHTGREVDHQWWPALGETEEKARQPEINWEQAHTNATKQSYATQSEAETKTLNPHTGRKAGLNHQDR